jgi:hypothetical protein
MKSNVKINFLSQHKTICMCNCVNAKTLSSSDDTLVTTLLATA